jgi:uncharacterized RDD family membrane protein YckC
MARAASFNSVDLEVAGQAAQARGRRFFALVIDLIGVSILLTIVNSVYGVTQVTSGSPIPAMSGVAYYNSSTAIPWPESVLLWLVYYIVPEGLFGASPGKMLQGLCVVRVDGRPLGFGAVVTRNVLRLIDALPGLYLIGGISVLATANSQRVGDRWAGTTVVRRDWALAVNPRATRRPAPGTARTLGIFLVAALLFTIAFDYFGRPPLVIDGLIKTQQVFHGVPVTTYRLSDPQWGLGTVTYRVTVSTSLMECGGTITLQWFGLGWTEGGASYSCPG